MPDAENVKFSKYIVEESRHMGDCSEVETLHLTKWSIDKMYTIQVHLFYCLSFILTFYPDSISEYY